MFSLCLSGFGCVSCNDVGFFLFESIDVLSQFVVLLLKSFDAVMHVGLCLVSNQSFLQAVCDRAIVKLLQGALNHTLLVSDSNELVTTLNTVKSDLTNNLIEALGEKLFTDGADAVRASFLLKDLLVQALLKVDNVCARCRRGGNITHPELVVLDDLLRRQDLVKVVLVTLFETRSALEGRTLLATLSLAAYEGT